MQNHPHAFVLLQPRLKLQDIIKDSPDVGQRSAFIGMVEETGSLYALSPSHSPLIGYGDLKYTRKGRLIDGSAPQEETEAPRHCEENPWDRRCLLGMHRLDTTDGHESRMKRLLEGPKDVDKTRSWIQWVEPTSLEVGAIDGTDVPANGSDSPQPISPPGGRSTVWEAAGMTLVLGVLSVWLLFKRFRIKEGAKSSALGADPIPPSVPAIPTPPQAVGEPIKEPTAPQEPPSVVTDAESPSEAPEGWVEVPSTPAAPVDDGDESDRDGEQDGDATPVPGRKKNRRGKRGKKKKKDLTLSPEDETDGGQPQEPSQAAPPPATTPQPLTPQSSIILPPPVPLETRPSLVVSEEILGEHVSPLGRVFCVLTFFLRLWFTWNCSLQRFIAGPCRRRKTTSQRLRHSSLSRGQHSAR